jgi:UDP-N-acetylmuramyl pentapeptide phosphotransferase/UDP-N-acetylglucosamine-1-phosphate transferase
MLTVLLLIVLILAFTGTFVIIRIAFKRNLLDIPNIRSSHTCPTPRGGGLAIVLSWYIGLVGLKYLNLIESNLFFALLSGSGLAFISFLDDLFSINPRIRIIIQLLTASLGLFFLNGIKELYVDNFGFSFMIILSIIAVFGAVWFINLYNFLDGIDGYASVEAISIALGIFLIHNNPVLLVLALAVAGFLIWNWPKAKIFMGDIGSTQLGYILIILGIYFNNTHQFNILGWLILTSLFWFDASLTLYRRWRNKEKLSQAHKKHAYQRIVQYGFSHQKAILFSIFINIFFIILVVLSEKSVVSYFITFPLCLLINYILIKLIDTRLPFNTSDSTE